MKEVCEQAQIFLNAVFDSAGFDLRATTHEAAGGCFLNLHGSDASLLRSEGGELLDALEVIVNQSFMRSIPQGERLICDVDDFRATREAELRVMARHAAVRVRSPSLPFTFAPMSANERCIIHLALANEADLHT